MVMLFSKNLPKIPKLIFIQIFQALGLFSSLPSELLDCDDLHSVIRLVLKAGNYMNAVGIFPHYNYVPVDFFDKWMLTRILSVAG